MKIESRHLDTFRDIRRRYRTTTRVPKSENWRRRDNDDIWAQVIGQVIVVGGSSPAEIFRNDKSLRQSVAYTHLVNLNNDPSIQRKIHSVLRQIGTRYASSDLAKCRKTAALAHNLRVLRNTRGGPKGFLRALSQLTGPGQDRRRIKYLMKCLSYIQSKGSRDFLMELGLVRNAIALDVRLMNVLNAVGIVVPVRQVQSNVSIYDEVETAILVGICKPLNLLGAEFDRMIYQNYPEIMRDLKQSG